MPDLTFRVERAEVAPFAAAPLLVFKLGIADADADAEIRAVNLTCQVKIEVARRHYGAHEHERLADLFGEPERWSQTLHSLLWTFTAAGVPAFRGSTSSTSPSHAATTSTWRPRSTSTG